MALTSGQIGQATLNEKSETSIGGTGTGAGVPSGTLDQDSGGNMQNDEEKQDGRDIALTSPPSPPSPSSPKITKPTRKSTVVELRQGLEALGLDIAGKKESLYKRLLKAFHKAEETEATPSGVTAEEEVENSYARWAERAQGDWRSFLCFDVEATCRGGKEFDWPNEVIEFPVVLLRWVDREETAQDHAQDSVQDSAQDSAQDHAQDSDTGPEQAGGDTVTSHARSSSPPRPRRLEKVDTFHSYVRPTWSPVLTDFCTALTGITQDMVDRSPTFPEMLKDLEAWLDKHDLRDEDNRLKNAMWVTDGPWDLRDFIPKQLFITPVGPPAPAYFFGQYLNIKQAVQTVLSEIWRAENPPPPPSRGSTPTPDGVEGSPSKRLTERQHHLPNPARVITTHKTMTKAFREGNWKGPNYYFNIAGQVSALDLGKFQGRQHSGLDDATNISRILIALSEKDRVVIEPNARVPYEKDMKRWPWMGKDGTVKLEDWMSKGSGVSTSPTRIAGSDEGDVPVDKDSVDRNGGEDNQEHPSSRGPEARAEPEEKEVRVWDMRVDAFGGIKTLKVPLSEANEITRKAYETKQAAKESGGDTSRSEEEGKGDVTADVAKERASLSMEGEISKENDPEKEEEIKTLSEP